eukprot:CAMPEP_0182439616 /NCGR_PEP_ID=MMETSP1167-20130531/86546_1 /TAXON_ID=2988 /ORGANISM="Mallomonas Sp, Strain CCMP3275" /LENGTH=336 /DNA_ID=CAMNT_0024633359 /DNA_START=1112 /DNA_END=2119 /DNA_ORIENTATION=-
MVCDMLDQAFIPYICLDADPSKIIDARNRGLPVFYGDVSRPEILRNFDAGSAKACVVAIGDMTNTNKAVINLRRTYPSIPLLVRAKDRQHQSRLQKMFANIQVICPVLPDDSVVLTLPFGGAVLQTLGINKAEADSIIEDFREKYLHYDIDSGSSFLQELEMRLPSEREKAIAKENERKQKEAERLEKEREKERERGEKNMKDKEKNEGVEKEKDVVEHTGVTSSVADRIFYSKIQPPDSFRSEISSSSSSLITSNNQEDLSNNQETKVQEVLQVEVEVEDEEVKELMIDNDDDVEEEEEEKEVSSKVVENVVKNLSEDDDDDDDKNSGRERERKW